MMAVLVTMALGACGSGDPGRPTATVSDEMDEMAAAEITGVLRAEERADATVYFVLETDDGARVGLVLPHGSSAAQDGSSVLGSSGNDVATVGSRYDVGGGEYALAEDVWSDGPDVDELWLVGEIDEASD